MEYLNNMSEQTKESRALFMGWCKLHRLAILNSQFSKPPEKLITYKEKTNDSDFGPPFIAERYAQIDNWLTSKDWKSFCDDVQSRRDIAFDSDHLVLESCISMKPPPRLLDTEPLHKYSKPSTDQWVRYNQECHKFLSSDQVCFQTLVQGILQAAAGALEKVPPGKKKTYITKNTWDKIEKRNQCRRNGAPTNQIRSLNKEIAKSARLDRRNHLIEQFNENPNDPNKTGLWRAVRQLKIKFIPQYVQMKNGAGERVPLTSRAETIAEYLETNHWMNDFNIGMPDESNIWNNNGADDGPFRLDELHGALKRAKNNKQPGPDDIRMELLKWLDDANRQCLLNLINKWWIQREAPKELFAARVVPLYKKGDTDNAANYRPISLLSSLYKIYMMMIRQRMQDAIDDKLSPTQYGFRPNKSTSHAIYVIRRIQDYAESKGTRLSLSLLDWEKAFDKIQHDKLILALKRMGFNAHFCDVIKNCYRDPTFFVKDAYGCSSHKRQSAGIRQGCPLSPYLFVIVMSCVDFDIRSKSSRVANNRIPGLTFDMVYYADDTILFSTDNRALNELLALTESVSSKYGLRLNKDKCVVVQMNNDGLVHFANNEPLPKRFETMYLGNEINKEANIRHEILNKIQEVRKIWFRLLPYWKATNANKKWQLLIFDAVIRSKLLYGLETIHLTQAMLTKIDAFQLRSLRKILGIAPTFVDRRNTNVAVLQKCTDTAFPDPGDRRTVQLFSSLYLNRKAKLLGHVIRSSNDDPLRQVSFEPDTAVRVHYGKKRCGRPRQNWLHYAKKYVFEERLNRRDYSESFHDDSCVYNAAINREF